MIRLDQNKLRNMYPEMTEEFSDRMHHMVHTLPLNRDEERGRIMVKKRFSVAFVFILIVMTSSLVALACSHGYVIQYLFGENVESEEALKMETQIQPIDYIYHSDTTMCTVKDAYFDGETLAIGLGFKTDHHLYLVGDEIKVNDDWVDYVEYSASIEEMWVGNIPPNKEIGADEKIHGVEYVFERPIPKGETVEVTMSITMLAPRVDVEQIDVYQEDNATMWSEIDAAYEEGLTPLDADEPYEVLISTGWWNGEIDTTSSLQKPYCSVDALVEYANMEVVDTMTVTFMLNVL